MKMLLGNGYKGLSEKRLRSEPFAKVLEWFDFQVSMEEVYRFPLLRLKPFDAPPPFVIPAKAGLRLYPNVKKSFKTTHLDLVAVYPILLQKGSSGLNSKNSSESTHRCRQRTGFREQLDFTPTRRALRSCPPLLGTRHPHEKLSCRVSGRAQFRGLPERVRRLRKQAP